MKVSLLHPGESGCVKLAWRDCCQIPALRPGRAFENHEETLWGTEKSPEFKFLLLCDLGHLAYFLSLGFLMSIVGSLTSAPCRVVNYPVRSRQVHAWYMVTTH